jgi:hypothetical protein
MREPQVSQSAMRQTNFERKLFLIDYTTKIQLLLSSEHSGEIFIATVHVDTCDVKCFDP